MNTKRLLLTALIAAPMIGVMQADMGIQNVNAASKENPFDGVVANKTHYKIQEKFTDAKPAFNLKLKITENWEKDGKKLDNNPAYEGEYLKPMIKALSDVIQADVSTLADTDDNKTMDNVELQILSKLYEKFTTIQTAAEELPLEACKRALADYMGVDPDEIDNELNAAISGLEAEINKHPNNLEYDINEIDANYNKLMQKHPLANKIEKYTAPKNANLQQKLDAEKAEIQKQLGKKANDDQYLEENYNNAITSVLMTVEDELPYTHQIESCSHQGNKKKLK